MKAETQAVLLEKMMQDQKVHPEYELSLPLFMLKRTVVNRLDKGDILLVGLDKLEFILIYNGNKYANVVLVKSENIEEIEIISMDEIISPSPINSKYEMLKCIFSTLAIEVIDVGIKANISKIGFEDITLITENNDKKLEGKLVEVEGEIAIEITKVYNA